MKRLTKPFFIAIAIVNAVSLVGLTLYAAIAIPAFSMWFYRWQFNANQTYIRVQMEPEHLHQVTQHMIRYMQGRESELQIMTYVNGEPRYFFSQLELRHMEDVRWLFWLSEVLMWTFMSLFLATILLFILFGRARWRYIFRTIQITMVAIFTFIIALGVAVAINWNRAFVIFHEIFFDNDYWILRHGHDLMLDIVPYDFFIAVTIFMGSFLSVLFLKYLGISTLVLWLSKRHKRKCTTPPVILEDQPPKPHPLASI